MLSDWYNPQPLIVLWADERIFIHSTLWCFETTFGTQNKSFLLFVRLFLSKALGEKGFILKEMKWNFLMFVFCAPFLFAFAVTSAKIYLILWRWEREIELHVMWSHGFGASGTLSYRLRWEPRRCSNPGKAIANSATSLRLRMWANIELLRCRSWGLLIYRHIHKDISPNIHSRLSRIVVSPKMH